MEQSNSIRETVGRFSLLQWEVSSNGSRQCKQLHQSWSCLMKQYSILTITKKSEKNGQSFPMLLFTPDKWAADNVAYMDMFPQCWSSLHTGSPSGSLSFFSCSMLLVLWINQWCWLISNILNRHSSCNILTCRGLSGNRSDRVLKSVGPKSKRLNFWSTYQRSILWPCWYGFSMVQHSPAMSFTSLSI